MIYFINGMFWQQGTVPFIGYESGVGSILKLGHRQLEAVFSGIIGDHVNENTTDGFLTDIFGRSEVTDLTISETHLSFSKRYIEREHAIAYTFTKTSDGTWIGNWKSNIVGKGEARCITTPIPDDFFTKPLKKKKVR